MHTCGPPGIRFLIGLRGELLAELAASPSYAAPLRALAEELRGLLARWFTGAVLTLERLTWHSSASVLQEARRRRSLPPPPFRRFAAAAAAGLAALL